MAIHLPKHICGLKIPRTLAYSLVRLLVLDTKRAFILCLSDFPMSVVQFIFFVISVSHLFWLFDISAFCKASATH
jgi:hypothetical protein